MLLLTCDVHYIDDKKYSYFVFDPFENKIIEKVPHVKELECPQFENSGRPISRPFGITTTNDEILVSSNANIVAFDKSHNFKKIVTSSGVVNTHQIKTDDNYIFRTNTSNDSISRIDMKSGEEIHFDFIKMERVNEIIKPTDYKSNDTMHINSIHVMPTSIFVLANNLGNETSSVFIIDKNFDKCQKITELGTQSHEIVQGIESFFILSSGTGELVEFDFNTQSADFYDIADPKEYFLRGACSFGTTITFFGNQLKTRLNEKSPVTMFNFNLLNNDLFEEDVPEFALICSCTKFNA